MELSSNTKDILKYDRHVLKHKTHTLKYDTNYNIKKQDKTYCRTTLNGSFVHDLFHEHRLNTQLTHKHACTHTLTSPKLTQLRSVAMSFILLTSTLQ